MTEPYPAIKDILPEGMNVSELLSRLKERVLAAGDGIPAPERGKIIKKQFPHQALTVIRLAEEALNGQLVLPGTGPELCFVGNPPEWTANPVNDSEYTFHLNRMHHWKTMCEAYSLTGDLRYADKVFQEINDWISRIVCPSLTDDTGVYTPEQFEGCSPWRALETGIRGYRTWPFVVELLADTPYMTESFLEKLLPCVYLHCRVLHEISPLLWPKADHNHYLMENLGLLSFSCLFPEMKDSGTFQAHALKELDRCMEAQCTPCGGQIEGCPSYHNGCVFWFSMRNVLARKYHIEESDSYTRRLHAMFIHSVHATRACGGNFPWGDSHTAEKETMSLAAVACYMATGDRSYLGTAACFYPVSSIINDVRDNLWRIPDTARLKADLDWAEANPQTPKLPLMAWQKDLDQVYIRSSWKKDAVSLMTACRTPVQNLHAHMDPGGFDYTAWGLPLISDPGIYTYKDDENRYRFKRAASHNCLTVNNADPWEYSGSWKYGPQKEGWICAVDQSEDGSLICVTSRHENYAPAIAIRYLILAERRFLLVIDHVTGLAPSDQVQVHYHLNRTVLQKTNEGIPISFAPAPVSILSLDKGPCIELTAGTAPDAVSIEDGKISTGNDVWHDSRIVTFHIKPDSSGECFFSVLAVPHRTSPGRPTAAIRQFAVDGAFFADYRADGRAFRIMLKGNRITKEVL